ncbi:MAG TPA: hypothetical protein VGM51_13110 [Armatimonadota bacterium]|jgi:uncharacterized membrane protein
MVTIDPSLIVVHGRSRPFDPTGHAAARGINDSREVTGQRDGRAFIWRNGRFSSLGVLPHYFESAGLFINNRGQIAGTCTRPALFGDAKWVDAYAQPFIWERGVMRRLGTLPDCPRLFPTGMNNHGIIVGHGRGKHMHPVVWLKGYAYEFWDLVIGAGGWSVTYALDIDERGRILAMVARPAAPAGQPNRLHALLIPTTSVKRR